MNSKSNVTWLHEKPPSLNYSIRLATADEKQQIIENLKNGQRQTMNFRTMADAGALVLFDLETPKKMIGWQGFTLKGIQGIPEKFSLHLDNAYRSFLLGLALETVLYKYLSQNSIEYTVLRMDRNSTESLMNYRTTTGILSEVPRAEMPKEWLSMCGQCELFKKTCVEQSFFKVDVQKGIQFGEKRLGPLGKMNFPVQITLVEDRMRQSERKFSARWAA